MHIYEFLGSEMWKCDTTYHLKFSMALVLLIIINLLTLQEREKQEEELKAKEAELIRGNPLLNNPTSFNVKRRFVA